MFNKKRIKPEDIKSEDIAKEIEKSLYGVDTSKHKAFSKLATFFMLFYVYVYLSINIETLTIKLFIVVFGIIILIFLLQEIVIPAFNKKQKKSFLEP